MDLSPTAELIKSLFINITIEDILQSLRFAYQNIVNKNEIDSALEAFISKISYKDLNLADILTDYQKFSVIQAFSPSGQTTEEKFEYLLKYENYIDILLTAFKNTLEANPINDDGSVPLIDFKPEVLENLLYKRLLYENPSLIAELFDVITINPKSSMDLLRNKFYAGREDEKLTKDLQDHYYNGLFGNFESIKEKIVYSVSEETFICRL